MFAHSAFGRVLHFQQWFPDYGFIFDHTLHTNCTAQYTNYLKTVLIYRYLVAVVPTTSWFSLS